MYDKLYVVHNNQVGYKMTFNQAFSIRTKKLLKEKGVSQYKLEQATGISHSTMTSILCCKTKASNFKTIALIIRELGISMTDFFNDPVFDFENLEIDD